MLNQNESKSNCPGNAQRLWRNIRRCALVAHLYGHDTRSSETFLGYAMTCDDWVDYGRLWWTGVKMCKGDDQ